MENMDPQRLPIEHLLIMTEKFSTIDSKFHKVSLLDHEAIKDAIEHGTKFDIMYKTSPGEGKMEVVTHSIMNNLDFTFNAYSAKNSTVLTIEKYLDLIVDELSENSRSKDAIAPQEKLLRQVLHFKGRDDFDEECLRALIKTYTANSCYRGLSQSLQEGKYQRMQYYLSLVLQKFEIVAPKLCYKELEKPLYRGVALKYIDFQQYKLGQIGYFPGFTSTSKDLNVAIAFATGGGNNVIQGGEYFIYEIFMTGQNSPPSNIELPNDWTYYKSEQEVLLFPFFCFIVTRCRKQIINDLPVIVLTLVELPRQNLLAIRPIVFTRLIWLDANINTEENKKYAKKLDEEFKEIGYSQGQSIEEGIRLINSSVRSVIIVSGSMGITLIPRIQLLKQVKIIAIFCGKNKERYLPLMETYSKVKIVANNFHQVMTFCKEHYLGLIGQKDKAFDKPQVQPTTQTPSTTATGGAGEDRKEVEKIKVQKKNSFCKLA
ncbi:hypothetical protein FGO68_gene17157 [Halteria grandinella]|uniref:NAD(P)(+)--arginine ADP-ribosyltransferase n=1 Tax=Halteria grandinella TaxID=5974 RepID=A0A8J8P2Z6_HALGN|nr:hypothetical protein FGO68_gene17157 [Halteria grandinella]